MNNKPCLKSLTYQDLPELNKVAPPVINENYIRVKKEVVEIIKQEIERILDTPGLNSFSKSQVHE